MRRVIWKRGSAVLALGSVLLAFAGVAQAQGFGGLSPYHYESRESYLMAMSAYRVALVLGASGLGFALGALFSPQGKELRGTLVILLGFAGFFVVAINNGPLGWGTAILGAAVGFALALGYWVGRGVQALREVPTTFGSSQWADTQHLVEKNVFAKKGVRLGKAWNGTALATIFYHGDRHLLTVAPTRSGKGVAQIVPNLLTYPGSALVIDPKGENALITSEARMEMDQQVFNVDPWGITHSLGLEPARFNPLDWLGYDVANRDENAMLLADAMIVQEGQGDPFWVQEAKGFLQGIILYVVTEPSEEGQRTLGRVRDLCLLDGEDMQTLFQNMVNADHHGVASTGARCLQKDDKLFSNVLASVQAQTHFLDSPYLRDSLSASDFRFEDMKHQPMTINLVLPADRLDTFGRWLRLLVQQAITVNARNIEEQPEHPVLFILDEMASLGKLTMVEQAYGLMAGFGIQLWGIVQDLGQLKRIYGESYESFIANSGAVSYFGSPDKLSAEYFSDLCGVTTVWNFSSAVARAFGSSSGGSGGGSTNQSITTTDTRAASQRKLAYADELMRMDQDLQLVLIEGTDPIIAHKARWFEDPVLKAKGVDLRATPSAKMFDVLDEMLDEHDARLAQVHPNERVQ